jgi:hypothetical protein
MLMCNCVLLFAVNLLLYRFLFAKQTICFILVSVTIGVSFLCLNEMPAF